MGDTDAELFTVDDSEATFHSHPTQSKFETFAKNHQQIVALHMSFESDDYPPLDFSRICLPNLQRLELRCVNVHLLQLTQTNTPSITSISLDNLTGEMGLHLELPELLSFSAEHTFVGGEASHSNDFGLSISRCPKLKTIHTYKFRGLAGKNYCVLPSCESITLYRSECTDSLEILSAPKLTELNVRAAYGLDHLRVWDFSAASLADAIKLNTGEAAAVAAAELARNNELQDWKTGKKGDEDAVALGFISKRGGWKESYSTGYGSESVNEHAYNKVYKSTYTREMLCGPTQLVLELMDSSDTYAKKGQNDSSLPSFEIDTTNMKLSSSTQKHLTQHPRCSSINDDEDGNAYMFEGAGLNEYMAMTTGSTMGEAEFLLKDLVFNFLGLVSKNVPLSNQDDDDVDGMLRMVYSQETTGVTYGHLDLVETYVRMHDPDINMSFVVNRLLEQMSCLEEESVNQVLRLLEKYGFNMIAQDLNGNTVLHRLFMTGQHDQVQMWTNPEGRVCNADWFKKGITVDVVRYALDTCLGGRESLKLLNKKGETIEDMINQRKEKWTQLMGYMGTDEALKRCQNEFEEMATLLLKGGPEAESGAERKGKKRRKNKK